MSRLRDLLCDLLFERPAGLRRWGKRKRRVGRPALRSDVNHERRLSTPARSAGSPGTRAVQPASEARSFLRVFRGTMSSRVRS